MSRNENVLLTPSKLLSPMKRLMRQRRSSPYKVEKSTPRKDKRKLFAEESNLKNGIVESKVDDDNEFQQLDKLGLLKHLFKLSKHRNINVSSCNQ